MKSSRTFSIVPAAAVVMAIFLGGVSRAANPPGVNSLIAKGVRLKTEKDGTVIELSPAPRQTSPPGTISSSARSTP